MFWEFLVTSSPTRALQGLQLLSGSMYRFRFKAQVNRTIRTLRVMYVFPRMNTLMPCQVLTLFG